MGEPDIKALVRRATFDEDQTAVDDLITINLDLNYSAELRLAAYEALERCYYTPGEIGDYAEEQATRRGARRP